MGRRQIMLTAFGELADTLPDMLDLEQTGECFSIPDYPVSGCHIGGDGYALCVWDSSNIEVSEADLAALSLRRRLLWNLVNETCMCSAASEWRNGSRIWYVEHISDKGLEHLETVGDCPPALEGIIREALEELRAQPEQSEWRADYVFDVPELLVAACGGVRDTDYSDEEDAEPVWMELRKRSPEVSSGKSKLRWWWPFG